MPQDGTPAPETKTSPSGDALIASQPKRPAHRPTDYNQEIAHEICERIAMGQGLVEIGEADEMPSERTIHRWLNAHEEFRQKYTDARDRQADHYLDEIKLIADDGRNDWVERHRRNGETEIVLDREHVERSKLRVMSTQWVMAKLAPKKYGDKMQHEHSGTVTLELSNRLDNAIKRIEQTPAIDVTPERISVQDPTAKP